jgi:hypothetical protein
MVSMRPDDNIDPNVLPFGGDSRQPADPLALERGIALAEDLLEAIGTRLPGLRAAWLKALGVAPAQPCLMAS